MNFSENTTVRNTAQPLAVKKHTQNKPVNIITTTKSGFVLMANGIGQADDMKSRKGKNNEDVGADRSGVF